MISETRCTIQTSNLNFGTHCQVNMVHSRLDFVNRRNSLAMLANPPVGPLSSYYGKCKSLPLPLFCFFFFFFSPSQVEENFIKREKQAKKTTAQLPQQKEKLQKPWTISKITQKRKPKKKKQKEQLSNPYLGRRISHAISQSTYMHKRFVEADKALISST